MNARFAAKWKLVQLLYQRGWDKQQVIDLFSVLDWMMRLPEQLKRSLWHNIEVLEEQEKMRYVTSVEQIGIEKGLLQGMQQGMQQGLMQGRQEGRMTGRAEGEAYALRRLLQNASARCLRTCSPACKPPALMSWSCGWIAPWMPTVWLGCLLSNPYCRVYARAATPAARLRIPRIAYARTQSYAERFATAESPVWIALTTYDSPWKGLWRVTSLSLSSFTFPTPAGK